MNYFMRLKLILKIVFKQDENILEFCKHIKQDVSSCLLYIAIKENNRESGFISRKKGYIDIF